MNLRRPLNELLVEYALPAALGATVLADGYMVAHRNPIPLGYLATAAEALVLLGCYAKSDRGGIASAITVLVVGLIAGIALVATTMVTHPPLSVAMVPCVIFLYLAGFAVARFFR